MKFTFTVEVEVQRNQGKFATHEEIADQIQEALEGADPGTYQGENEGEYETSSWEVSENPPNLPAKKDKLKGTLIHPPAPSTPSAS
jgi:hypothetical protein